MKNKLPNNWTECVVRDVSNRIHYGYTAKTTSKNTGVHYLRITDIQDYKVDWSKVPFCLINDDDIEKYDLSENDLVFARTGATVGKSFLLRGKIPKAVFASYLIRIILSKEILPEYISFYFQSPLYWRQIDRNAKGSGQPNVNAKILSNLTLPLPPLAEQKRIVAKLDELMGYVERCKQRLAKVPEVLKAFRQSVLAQAVSGELTSPTLSEGDSPKHWKRKIIKDVCSNIKVGIVIKPTQYYSPSGEGIHAFRSANVREFKVNDSNWVYFSEESNEKVHRTKLYEGDVLIVRSGYPGTSCVVPKEYEGANAIDILIATPDKTIINPNYLCIFNNSPFGKGLFSKGARGMAQKHLNVGVYGKLEIPLPPLKEQQEIVKRVEALFARADAIEAQYEAAMQYVETLPQAILAKAFRGELVEQDANDEPASVLLERIKAAQEALKKGDKNKNKKNTKNTSHQKKLF